MEPSRSSFCYDTKHTVHVIPKEGLVRPCPPSFGMTTTKILKDTFLHHPPHLVPRNQINYKCCKVLYLLVEMVRLVPALPQLLRPVPPVVLPNTLRSQVHRLLVRYQLFL